MVEAIASVGEAKAPANKTNAKKGTSVKIRVFVIIYIYTTPLPEGKRKEGCGDN